MFKNGVKSRLTLLFKELWAVFFFHKTKKNILEGDFGENTFFEKNMHKKCFHTEKHQINSMSKNGVKSRLTLLFKKLWAFFVFQKKRKSLPEGDF